MTPRRRNLSRPWVAVLALVGLLSLGAGAIEASACTTMTAGDSCPPACGCCVGGSTEPTPPAATPVEAAPVVRPASTTAASLHGPNSGAACVCRSEPSPSPAPAPASRTPDEIKSGPIRVATSVLFDLVRPPISAPVATPGPSTLPASRTPVYLRIARLLI